MSTIDLGGAVREGEELDVRAVGNWLIEHGSEISGPAEVTQYSGGASNWTYRLKYKNADLILRRPPKGTKAKSAHDMVREFNVQNWLAPFYPVVPEMVALCQDESIIGCDFYVMKRIEGIIPRAKLPPELNFGEKEVRELCINVLDKLIELHNVPYQGTKLESLGKGDGYCRRQVEGWDTRYEKAQTLNVPSFKFVRKWLKDNIHEDSKSCVIHNDWRFDNVILDPQNPTPFERGFLGAPDVVVEFATRQSGVHRSMLLAVGMFLHSTWWGAQAEGSMHACVALKRRRAGLASKSPTAGGDARSPSARPARLHQTGSWSALSWVPTKRMNIVVDVYLTATTRR